MQYPKTRQQAKAQNSEFYFTGKLCKHGHIDKRITKRGECVTCRKDNWQIDNAKRVGKPQTEASKRGKLKYYEKNRDAVIARALARPEEDKRRYRKTWKLNNPLSKNMHRNAWRRRQKDACPSWLSKDDRQRINDIYMQAQLTSQTTGRRYVVDHIIPITSNVVCGLHVPWNLRVITNEENAKKWNKL